MHQQARLRSMEQGDSEACSLHPSVLQPLVCPGQPYCPKTSCLMAQVEPPSCQARY